MLFPFTGDIMHIDNLPAKNETTDQSKFVPNKQSIFIPGMGLSGLHLPG
jgi:hypothetical protein